MKETFAVLLWMVRSKELIDPMAKRFFCLIAKNLGEAGIDPRNPELATDHDDGVWNAREQLAEMQLLVLELAAQADQRLQVRLQDIAAMQQQLLVNVAVWIGLVIKDT